MNKINFYAKINLAECRVFKVENRLSPDIKKQEGITKSNKGKPNQQGCVYLKPVGGRFQVFENRPPRKKGGF
jgi:hypothetical protein